jgi:hypothetical protein
MKPKFPGVIVSIDENDITAWDIINKCARAATRSGLVGSGWQMIFANQCLAAAHDRNAVLKVAKKWF